MSARPDWVKCIRHEHAELSGMSWCGRELAMEWAFLGAEHAANTGREGGRLVACPECVAAVCAALRNGHDDLAQAMKP